MSYKKIQTVSPTAKKWISVAIRIIVIIASAIGGDTLDVINLISEML